IEAEPARPGIARQHADQEEHQEQRRPEAQREQTRQDARHHQNGAQKDGDANRVERSHEPPQQPLQFWQILAIASLSLPQLHATARSLGAEVTSPWFYLQFGLILTAGGIAWASEASIRARVDMTSLAMRWPVALRRFAHVLVGSTSTVVFAILVIVERVVMVHSTWPSRSYLLAVSAKLA